MIPSMRDIGGFGGLGQRRYQRYCAAFDRVEHCVESGYFLEAIAILDSLIWDRLASRLDYITGKRIDSRMTTNQLCNQLVGNGTTTGGSEKDIAFRNVVMDIRAWVHKRNDAVHATAKVFRADTSKKDFAATLRPHRQTAFDGIHCLQTLDRIDTKDRAKAGKYPANFPDAFFPRRRTARSHARSRDIWTLASLADWSNREI